MVCNYSIRALTPRKEDRPMRDVSRRKPSMTVGIDLGDKYSYLCLLDTESGEVIEEGRLRTTPEDFRRRFSSEQPPMRIAIEAGTHSPWASRVLEECAHEVLVANARKLRLIYADKKKTDQIDALRTWPAWRAWTRSSCIHSSTGAKTLRLTWSHGLNPLAAGAGECPHPAREPRVRGTVNSFGGRLPKCPARSFHNRAPEHVPEALRPALGPILETIGSLTERIRDYDRKLETTSKGQNFGSLTAISQSPMRHDPFHLGSGRAQGLRRGLVRTTTSRRSTALCNGRLLAAR
jgi:hypothetical protein